VSPACFQCHRTTPEKQASYYGYHRPDPNTVPHETQPAGIQRD
jgi:hypothetical protein